MTYKKFIVAAVLAVCLVASMASPMALAATAAKASTKTTTKSADNGSSKAVSTGGGGVQGYAADSVIQDGTIVQLSGAGASKVAVSTRADLGHMYGVTVDRQQLSVSISDTSLKNEVFVATSGTYDVLVSNQGGTIHSGDYVTLSALDGVAMEAGTGDTTVFGRAGSNFDGKSDSIGKATLKDTSGKASQNVALGIIPVAIDIKRNPQEKSTKTNVPPFLQRLGQAIAEKTVTPLRIYLSIGITGITIIATTVILYSGVRNSLISIGRNPLSKKSIFRALLEIILTSLLILIIGLFAVYLLLKL